jgi:hypothetical protein
MRLFAIVVLLFAASPVMAGPATRPVGLPHIAVNIRQKQVRVDCEAVKADYPLEFLAVMTNTNEYEAIVRTDAKPSDLHLALLMIGLKPGEPVHYSEAAKKWLPPSGPPVDIWFEYQKDGQAVKVPAYRWMRDVKTRKVAPPMLWVFTGSKVMDDHSYAADSTGCLVSVINNEYSVLDVPALKSRALEARDYERNPDLMPPTGTAVTMILSPAADADADTPPTPKADPAPGTAPGTGAGTGPGTGPGTAPGTGPTTAPVGLSNVHIDQAKVDRLKQYWEQEVGPHRKALQEAAQAHYKVITDLRHEQQRLIDEADHIQRTIDELEKEYQDMTTPQPEPAQ